MKAVRSEHDEPGMPIARDGPPARPPIGGIPARWRGALALAASLALHGALTLTAPSARGPRAAAAAAPDARAAVAPITFVVLSAQPPAEARRPRVVVVGATPAGHGGSVAGGAAAGARAVPRRSATLARPAAAPAEPEASSPATPDRASESAAPVAAPVSPFGIGDPSAAPEADPDQAYRDLAARQAARLAAGRGAGSGGFGQGGGRSTFALAIDLSGRHVASSPVVVSPVVVEERRVACEIVPGRLRAVVRLLVTRDGAGAAPRVLETSGQARFDACALRYARALRFSPGTDASGRPIDTWVHVGVTPAVTNHL